MSLGSRARAFADVLRVRGLAPYHSWFSRAVLRPLWFLNVVLLVWSVMQRSIDE